MSAIQSGNFKLDRFLISVDVHFRKPVDFLLMDVRHLNEAQKAEIGNYINVKYSDQLDRLIKIE